MSEHDLMDEDDMMAYEQLVDPDDGAASAQVFGWGEEMNRNILGMILGDRQFLTESIDLLRPSYFENKAHKALSSVVLDHFQEWKTIPNRAIILEKLKSRFKDDEDKLFYLTEFDLCRKAYTPGLDSRDYNINLLTGFAKKQAMTEAVRKVLEEIKRGDFTSDATLTRIYGHLDKARAVDRKFVNVGLDYFPDLESRYEQMSEERETVDTFTTGFKRIDDALSDGGMQRGELASVIANSGTGKSLWLTKAAWLNVLNGRRVLYISTEMSELSIAKRFDALFSGHDIRTLVQEQEIVKPIIRGIGQEFCDNEEIGTNKLLLIKQFAPKSANIDTFRSLLVQLQMNGWVPDMVLLDYVGECKVHSDMKKYESLELLVSEFHGLAVENKFFGMTAMQPNRSGRDAQKEGVIDDNNLGDAYGQTRPLDAFWSINQRDEEKKMGVARIFCIKHRNGESRFLFYVQFDKATLEYREINEHTYRNIMQGYKDDVSGDLKIDEFFANQEKKSKKKPRMKEEPDPE